MALGLVACGPDSSSSTDGVQVGPIGSVTTAPGSSTTSNSSPTTAVGSTTTPSAPVHTTVAPSTTDTTAPAGTLSLLQRRDAPLAEVASILGFYAGGSDRHPDCTEVFRPKESDPPAVAVPGPEARTRWDTGDTRIGFSSAICVSNFRAGPPIRLVVRGPRGVVIDQSLCSPCSGALHSIPWSSFPGDSVGNYTVTASQENTEVGGVFRLLHGTSPILYVDKSPGRGVDAISPGSTIRVGLSGYPPNAAVAVDMFHHSSAGEWYVTSLEARTDSDGEWVTSIATLPDDPLGCYTFATRPPVGSSSRSAGRVNGFCFS